MRNVGRAGDQQQAVDHHQQQQAADPRSWRYENEGEDDIVYGHGDILGSQDTVSVSTISVWSFTNTGIFLDPRIRLVCLPYLFGLLQTQGYSWIQG